MTQGEDAFNEILCHALSGEKELRHSYSYGDGKQGYVIVDCETESHVVEGRLEKRSSLDSLQQPLFFSALTGKSLPVVIYDINGKFGKYEHRIQAFREKAGVLLLRLPSDHTLDCASLAVVLRGEQVSCR